MIKKLAVISHERSGSSFLINSIGGHFPDYLLEFGEDNKHQRVDIDALGWNFADPEEMRNFLSDSRFHDVAISNPFKSHHHFDYFKPVWDYVVDQFKVIYIYRGGRDVLTSFWRHVRKQGFLWGPQTFTVGDFMRAKPSGGVCRYDASPPPQNMVDRWQQHILSWMNPMKEEICYVSYEELSLEFDQTIHRIGRYLEMDITGWKGKPKLSGVHPWRGKIGNWKEYFDTPDKMFYGNNAKKAVRLLKEKPFGRKQT